MRFCGRALLCAALALAACSGSDEVTAIKLVLQYETSWNLERFDVTAAGRSARADVGPAVRILVPDTLAGTLVPIQVVGVRGGERVASGRTSITPMRGKTVLASVTMARVPCGAWCSAGATACVGDATVICTRRPSDGCFEWSAPVACPAQAHYCSQGSCSATCIDECAEGEKRCDGAGGLRLCGQNDSDTCREWGPVIACATGESCSNGACTRMCQNECSDGELRCFGAGPASCADLDQNGCTEWGPVEPCAAGTTCSMGTCSGSCTDECTSAGCQGLTYQQCGQYDLDSCRERSPGLSCVPAEPCLEGQCASTGCVTAPRVCDQPPASMCVGASTLRVYDGSGLCDAGGCSYASRDVACANCPSCNSCAGVVCNSPPSPCFAAVGTCAAGSCTYPYANGAGCTDGNSCTTGDQCQSGVCSGTAIACTTPPAPTCMGNTLRTSTGTGTCSAGSCTYAFGDATCPGGCAGGACTAACIPFGWQVVTVDAVGDVGTSSSIVTDASGSVLDVSYYDGANQDLKYAHRSAAGVWSISTIESILDVGQFSSIARDRLGGLHVSSFQNTVSQLVYSQRSAGSSTWGLDTPDLSSDLVGAYTSLALDSQSGVHVSYYDGTNRSLKYVYRSSSTGNWTASTVDTVGDCGLFTSMEIDGQDGVHISHFDRENGDLRYAYRPSGGSWTTSTIDTAGEVGDVGALALDSAGGVHVSYHDDTNGDLRYAYRPAGGSWTASAIDTAGHVGGDTSIGVDSNGGVHVSYYDVTNGDLRYATKPSGGSWRIEVVDSGGNVGGETSLTVDATGGIHITYYDITNGDLKYAYQGCR